jgi:branched-chain amino acid transport system permease protein
MDLSLLADPAVLFELTFQGAVRGSTYALVAVGLSLIFGILRIVNFAQGEFFMLGSYVMFFVCTALGLNIGFGILASGIFVFAVGMAIERGLIRTLRVRSGREWLLDSFVLTIGIMIILQNLALIVFGGGRLSVRQLIPGSLSLGDISISYERLFILIAAAVTVGLLWAFIRFTRTGKAIRATSQDAEAAQTLGIDIDRVYTISFGLGAGLAGVAGAILIPLFPAYPTVGADPVLKGFAVVIIGGLGNVSGAIAGGLLLGILETYALFLTSAGWQSVLTVFLIVLVMIVKPSGLFAPRGTRV